MEASNPTKDSPFILSWRKKDDRKGGYFFKGCAGRVEISHKRMRLKLIWTSIFFGVFCAGFTCKHAPGLVFKRFKKADSSHRQGPFFLGSGCVWTGEDVSLFSFYDWWCNTICWWFISETSLVLKEFPCQSKVIHGGNFNNLQPLDGGKLMRVLQSIVRRCS